ncbi:MAG: hypothetical protein ACI9CO_000352 [Candidatus Azotimanducaceae bacterium]|jgi:hypothetical protein
MHNSSYIFLFHLSSFTKAIFKLHPLTHLIVGTVCKIFLTLKALSDAYHSLINSIQKRYFYSAYNSREVSVFYFNANLLICNTIVIFDG